MKAFKPILGYPNYKVSNEGQIKRLPHFWRKQAIIMKMELSKAGYYRVPLSRDGRYKKFLVSRLVAKAFIPNPDNLPEVNHKDGNTQNNNVSNLEWCTRSTNMLHAFKTGLHSMTKGEQCSWSKLTTKDVLKMRKIYSQGNISMKKLGKMFGITMKLFMV
jgi:hypothetical protein